MQQQQIFQIEEFRYTSGGCAGQLKKQDKLKVRSKINCQSLVKL